MPVEVKQLTINSVFQRAEPDDNIPQEDAEHEPKSMEQNKPEGASSCMDAAAVKSDVLNACKKMIRQALLERQVR